MKSPAFEIDCYNILCLNLISNDKNGNNKILLNEE